MNIALFVGFIIVLLVILVHDFMIARLEKHVAKLDKLHDKFFDEEHEPLEGD